MPKTVINKYKLVGHCLKCQCKKANLKRRECEVITEPGFFWEKYGKCFGFTNNPYWREEATEAITKYKREREEV